METISDLTHKGFKCIISRLGIMVFYTENPYPENFSTNSILIR